MLFCFLGQRPPKISNIPKALSDMISKYVNITFKLTCLLSSGSHLVLKAIYKHIYDIVSGSCLLYESNI